MTRDEGAESLPGLHFVGSAGDASDARPGYLSAGRALRVNGPIGLLTRPTACAAGLRVGAAGFEPATSRSQSSALYQAAPRPARLRCRASTGRW